MSLEGHRLKKETWREEEEEEKGEAAERESEKEGKKEGRSRKGKLDRGRDGRV